MEWVFWLLFFASYILLEFRVLSNSSLFVDILTKYLLIKVMCLLFTIFVCDVYYYQFVCVYIYNTQCVNFDLSLFFLCNCSSVGSTKAF